MPAITLPVIWALFLLAGASGAAAQQPDAGMQLYMPDGQLESHPVRIYIDHDISDAMVPELRLIGNRAFIDLKNKGTSGELWAVPWEMVTLMGMSQAGYLSPKLQPEPRGLIKVAKK